MTKVEAIELGGEMLQCAAVAQAMANIAPEGSTKQYLEDMVRGGFVATEYIYKQHAPKDWKELFKNIVEARYEYVASLIEMGGVQELEPLMEGCGETSKKQADIISAWRAENYQ
jgi:hypothetical protein